MRKQSPRKWWIVVIYPSYRSKTGTETQKRPAYWRKHDCRNTASIVSSSAQFEGKYPCWRRLSLKSFQRVIAPREENCTLVNKQMLHVNVWGRKREGLWVTICTIFAHFLTLAYPYPYPVCIYSRLNLQPSYPSDDITYILCYCHFRNKQRNPETSPVRFGIVSMNCM